jgi:hypothetical protein
MTFEAFIVPYAHAFTPMAKIEILRVARAKMLTDGEKLAAVTDYIAGNKQALWKAGQENLKRKQERNQSKRYKVRRTAWDALVAYCGSRRVDVFGGAWDAQQWIEARRAEGHSVDVEGVY